MSDQPFWINLLDMGAHKYGDSIFINHPDVKILVDGGYRAMAEDQPHVRGIPSQLGELLVGPPFAIDLLVVTHCHSDHIGCLPALVKNGTVKPTWALLADPSLGFPELPEADALPIRSDLLDLVSLAAADEPHDDLEEDELLAYLEDATTVKSRYLEMFDDLRDLGTDIVRYGRDSLTAFRQHFEPLGLTVLGPTRAHLRTCRDHLAELQSDAVRRVQDVFDLDGPVDGASRARLYRRALTALAPQDAALQEDRPGAGAALNDQSIVLLFESAGAKALLTGDMQLAVAEVPGLDDDMARLLDKLAAHAPFDFLKVAHHSSYNGLDRTVFDRLQARVYGHTGGRKSVSHPHRDVLELLRNHASDREWVRTDRNGRIGVRLGEHPTRLFLSTGHQNDYRLSPAADEPPPAAAEATAPAAFPAPRSTVSGPAEVRTVATGDFVEVTARIPHTATRVTITVDVAPGTLSSAAAGVDDPVPAARVLDSSRLAGGREVPRLLFVTARSFGSSIGSDRAAEEIVRAIGEAGHEVLEVPSSEAESAPEAAGLVQQRLAAGGPAFHGVVLLGNYDVVPAVALDVLDAELRAAVSIPDQDRFVVWSDDPYGDLDGDSIPELAVSRVLHEPGSADLLWKSLTAAGPESEVRFGIRNKNRPFAEDIFSIVPGSGPLLVSAPATHETLAARNDPGASDYFMLHGSARNATVFWGESDEEVEEVEAFQIDNVPESFTGVAFAGCCWGALPVTDPAGWRAPGQPVVPRTRANSIPIRYLAAGAWAFVGCTGTHYSPGAPPYSYFGAPFHQVFWTHVQAGYPPALALLNSKMLYAASIPHISGSPEYTAVELKILQQFTCLGLGW